MKMKKNNGFTLIELLTVIAIIGILAGILIPAVGKVLERSNIAASKQQLANYVNAIQLFKGEYNYYPLADAQVDGGAALADIGYDVFIGTLSARKLDGSRITSSDTENYGNRKLISFYTFSESDFLRGDPSTDVIADRFDNPNIYIAIDPDGDGKLVGMPDPDGGADIEVRNSVTAYTLEGIGPDYYLYD